MVSKITDGTWKPQERITEAKVSKELGVSRGAVREAMFKLVGEGLLERQPGVGCRVTNLTMKDFEEIFLLREAIEGMAIRIASQRATDYDLVILDQKRQLTEHLISVGDMERSSETDTEFHAQIMALSGNKTLISVWHSYHKRLFAYRSLFPIVIFTAEDHRTTIDEHRSIMDQLNARDPDGCEQVLRKHIRNGFAKLVAKFNQSNAL